MTLKQSFKNVINHPSYYLLVQIEQQKTHQKALKKSSSNQNKIQHSKWYIDWIVNFIIWSESGSSISVSAEFPSISSKKVSSI